ncbi:gamma-glutamyltransferase [Marinicauda salina]|uniref:Glutathione hydrolase proenzyme n=1 Tax=Marinicauda salina TaxID=2135793 RepID=A0A2U2BXR1_9PROT|nr:gamma-glutamyltransferase [Marinicauda salina]PWE18808.1 gamma-glutamyltransferase [Marinicauda salina]
MIRFPFPRAAGAVFALALAACGETETSAVAPPEDAAAAGETPREAMVAAAHPLAVEAGLDALRAGGSAVDAAIAVQAVLGLVEPQSSGLGGGAFMVRYDGESGEMTVYDGRETAPAAVDETLFLDEAGEPLDFVSAWTSGRSVGAPGAVAMLAMAHGEHGTLPWAAGFADAERLAEDGFAFTARTASLAERIAAYTQLDEAEPTASYFYDETGAPRPAGETVTNPAYAETVRAIAADWRNFYEGEIAEGIVAAVNQPPRPGFLTEDDIAGYEPVVRDAVCTPYRDYRICSAPPPSSGAVAVGQIMALLEGFDMVARGVDSAEGWHLFIEASRLAYADRDRYVGDPAFADVPVDGLLDPGYLDARAALIDPEAAMDHAEAGRPPGAPVQPEDASEDAPGTSHFVVVDFDGNVVSMTTTIESAFGSQRMTGGFLLNNQLTDFAFVPRDEAGRLRPNAVAPGKRPRSSMSPVIVLDEDGEFVLATGSPGGNSIIGYTAKSLVAMLDWGLEPDQAAALPNVVARGDTTNIEEGFDVELLAALREMGHAIEANQGENSGIHIVRIAEDGGLEGGADPRRDGVARGLTEAARP